MRLGEGLPELEDLRAEIRHYWAVLMGREPSPVDHGPLTLMEVAGAYYARAMEIQSLIHEAETEGRVLHQSRMYRFRTGELRDFTEVAKRAMELGSRRLTAARMEWEQTRASLGM